MKVLLVEDDNNLREIFQMRLQAEGYNALVAADGEEGLVTAMKEKPDLIIADVMMPKLSGFEMVENLRSAPEMKDTKVVMMTALGQAEDQARGEKLGVVKYLVKSQVTLEDFARVVKEVLGPGDPQATAPAQQVGSSTTNTQESESHMQDDNSTTNPAPADMPASEPTTPPSGAPDENGAAGGSQQSSSDEQSVVQDQINSFASSPAGDSTATPAADSGSGDTADTGAPAMPPASEPPAAPSEPPASTGSDDPGSTPPAAPNATDNAL